KAELDRIFDSAFQKLDRPMDDLELFRIVVPVVASIKCGHTRAALPAKRMTQVTESIRLLPLKVRVIDKKPFVFRDFALRDFAANERGLAGSEIRSINGVSADKVVATMLAAISGDGDIPTSRQHRISDWQFNVWLYTLFGLEAPFDLVFCNRQEEQERKVRLDGTAFPKLRALSQEKYPQDQPPDTPGEMKLVDDGRIAEMHVYGFGGVEPKSKKSLQKLFKEWFETMALQKTKALIIDVRGNNGGEDVLGKVLLSYLLDKPFKYY